MITTETVVKVGIADLKFAKSPGILRTSGLGSCVGVVVYDLSSKIAGMAHVMLPDSTQSRRDDFNELKYADTSIDRLVSEVMEQGGRKFALKAKIAGGAQMFSFSSTNDMLRVGARNVEAVLNALANYRIPILAQDVGGNSGRTIEFYPETGKLKIRTVNQGETEL
ncbi:chemotaxis protein CheD [Aquibacillus koreensis]|uniref:Probable chemoreceptor glutamine deamidase CheD n=1 Tax=Aquibacillus koreensis TaxID=279446 RepID=A0A9X3WN21_9BACI|nr:chemotaxis protein CheD [Aquibacillus koreensis]MCT2534546.1 chemotaxis protein CheD [Aquibacillus koreensis]MDC3421860.1 chemotaxis protein CheD [Aquibacillus koreensis]